MVETIIVCVAACIASLLTFFSGFGLGTILMPVFAIFFPIEVAIALTGVVHFLNNIFKLALVGKHADKPVVLRFGVPAFIAALIGAFVLMKITDLKPLASYYLGEREFFITPLKLLIGILLIFFSLMEVIPGLKKLEFGKDKLVLGGILSGFFGGLSGHQGALRSAFLVKSGLTKQAFIATGVVIACMVDISRLGVYVTRFTTSGLHANVSLIIAATLAAFAGAYLGSRLLQKITMGTIQKVVVVMLLMLSLGLAAGLI